MRYIVWHQYGTATRCCVDKSEIVKWEGSEGVLIISEPEARHAHEMREMLREMVGVHNVDSLMLWNSKARTILAAIEREEGE